MSFCFDLLCTGRRANVTDSIECGVFDVTLTKQMAFPKCRERVAEMGQNDIARGNLSKRVVAWRSVKIISVDTASEYKNSLTFRFKLNPAQQ